MVTVGKDCYLASGHLPSDYGQKLWAEKLGVVLMKGFDIQQNCYNCKHRQDVPGSTHSSCGVFKRNSDVHAIIAPSIVKLVLNGGQFDFITLNPHGVSNGWCSWPIDFDPCWVSDCKLWESK